MKVDNGYGSCMYDDGTSYFGNFKDGLRNGFGTLIFLSGECYAGNWQNDMMHGVGKWYEKNKTEWQGVWYEGNLIHKFITPSDSPSQSSPSIPSDNLNQRLALVIGNNAYQEIGMLRNCVNDARAFSMKLSSLGFDVITLLDGTKRQMDSCIAEFCNRASNYDTALFFYSGHGTQHHGNSFVIPTDFPTTQYIETSCCSVDDVIINMDKANCKLKIAILDACRSITRSLYFSQGKGLSNINAEGVFIAYATGPGQVASDGPGSHSPYMEAILSMLDRPNVPISAFFREVSKMVCEITSKRQIPWVESCLVDDDFFFNYE